MLPQSSQRQPRLEEDSFFCSVAHATIPVDTVSRGRTVKPSGSGLKTSQQLGRTLRMANSHMARNAEGSCVEVLKFGPTTANPTITPRWHALAILSSTLSTTNRTSYTRSQLGYTEKVHGVKTES
jgi:hypothetical protein